MTTAQINLVNRALGQLGEKPIEDFTDDTVRAGLSQREYDRMVAALFEQHDWNFAIKRVARLAPLADPPLWDYAYAFELPADCVRVMEVNLDRAAGGDGDRWKIEGRTLVADTATVSLRYIARVLEGLWPALFEDAVMFQLAARLCYGLTAKAALVPELDKQARAALALAKAVDGQTGSARRYHTGALTDVRT